MEVGTIVTHPVYGTGIVHALLYPYRAPIVVLYADGTKRLHVKGELTYV